MYRYYYLVVFEPSTQRGNTGVNRNKPIVSMDDVIEIEQDIQKTCSLDVKPIITNIVLLNKEE